MTMEEEFNEKLKAKDAEISALKSQLEITQAVVDEIALGGVL